MLCILNVSAVAQDKVRATRLRKSVVNRLIRTLESELEDMSSLVKWGILHVLARLPIVLDESRKWNFSSSHLSSSVQAQLVLEPC